MQPSSSTYRPGAVHQPGADPAALQQRTPDAVPRADGPPAPAIDLGLAATAAAPRRPGPSRRGRMVAGVGSAALPPPGVAISAVTPSARHAICADVQDALL